MASEETSETSRSVAFDVEVTPAMTAAFHSDGAVTIRGFALPSELASIQATFDDLMDGKHPIPGNDLGEHTPGLMNCTAFSLYHPLEGLGLFAELNRRALRVTEQLYGEPTGGTVFGRDYEQLLRKLPGRPGSVFPPHWDLQYWPRCKENTFDLRTATFSLAVNAADEENGCLWYLPGSHKLRGEYTGRVSTLDGSRPLAGGVLDVAVLPEDLPRRHFLALATGDATFHEEYVLHGSEANLAQGRTRDTLIFAFRAKSMIEVERKLGFRHSYNDSEEALRLMRGPPL
jgi:hypothetical protein